MYVYSFQINETLLSMSMFLFLKKFDNTALKQRLEKVNIYIHKTSINVAAFLVFCSKYNSVCVI